MTESQFAIAWWSTFRNQRLTVRTAIVTAMEGGDETAGLRALLAEIAPSPYPGAYSPHKLGRWLARVGDRLLVVDDDTAYRFVPRGAEGGGQVWQLTVADVSERYYDKEAVT